MMSPRSVLVFSFLILAACSSVPEPAKADKAASARTASSVKTRFPVGELRQGMTEQELLSQFGKPESHEELKGLEGRARVWVYRRVVVNEIRDVPGGTQMVPVFAGLGTGAGSDGLKMVPEAIMQRESFKVVEVTRLLVVDGRYVQFKQAAEESRDFVN